jgi:hypothetical protein
VTPPGDDVEHPCDCEDGWITCWSCGGEGDYHDCGEDCCCCAEPEFDERVDCQECHGRGGWRCGVCDPQPHVSPGQEAQP